MSLSVPTVPASMRAPDISPTVIFPASRDATTPDSAVMAPTAIFGVVMAPSRRMMEPSDPLMSTVSALRVLALMRAAAR